MDKVADTGSAPAAETPAAAAPEKTSATAAPAAPPAPAPASEAPAAPAAAEPAPYWGDDWRERLAQAEPEKNREATLARLKRFQSPENVFKSWRQLETAISSGQYRPTLKEGATPEEVAAYRKEIGVPEAPEGYLEGQLPGGFVIGEEDKPRASQFAGLFHKHNIPDAAAKDILAASYEDREAQVAQLTELDKQAAANAEHERRVEWGAEFQGNMSAIRALVETSGMPVDDFLQARLPDGSTLISNNTVMKWLVQTAAEINPIMTTSPAGTDHVQSATARLATIKAMMADRASAYWKDGGVLQAEYGRLLRWKEQHDNRAA